jgi:hypothetical protein
VAQDTFNASLFFYAFFALGAALLAMVGNSQPRWLSWSAAAIGLLLLIPVAGFAGALALEVWIVVVSIMALRRPESEVRTPD